MPPLDATTDQPATNGRHPVSFEVGSDVAGDLLSRERNRSGQPIRVGLVATSYFEFYRMYEGLYEQIVSDAEVVRAALSREHELVVVPLVDTLDSADEAGRMLRDQHVDLVVFAYRAYVPDAYIHHLLSYLPDLPILFFASQSRDKFDFDDSYRGVLRNSGIMAQIQLVAGFRKMNRYENVEAIAGSIHDADCYRRIRRYIDVVTIYKQLQTMTFGVIGNVFRGMFDFEYDKTKIKGGLGPEVMNIQIDHLLEQWTEAGPDDPDVRRMLERVRTDYDVVGVGGADLENAVRIAVALERLVERFRIDGLAVLCQHFLEAKLKATPYLGLSELHRTGACPATSEGDVVGLIMMKILKHLTGNMPFFVEWSEFDIERNAWMMLGHGFGDPTQANHGKPRLTPSAEQWGLEGTGCSVSFAALPGRCTMAHFIDDAQGWRMVITGGEILDLPSMPINDTHLIVKADRPVIEYTEDLVRAGIPHHAMTVRGDVRKELMQLAALMKMEVTLV